MLCVHRGDRAAYHKYRRDLRCYARFGFLIWAFTYSVNTEVVLIGQVAQPARTFGGNHGQPVFCLLHILEMALVVQEGLLEKQLSDWHQIG